MKQALRRILTSKYFLIPIAVLCLYSLIGFFVAPWVIGWYAPRFVKEQLQCQLDLGKVLINPFLLTFEVNDVSLSTSEPVPAEKLSMLAGDRSREIVKELGTVGGIPSERMFLKNPESLTSGPPSASFSLDVQTSSR